MNLPEELMQQLQATLAPPPVPEIPAKRLLDLQIKLDKAEKERERLTTVHQRKQEEVMQAEMRQDNKRKEVQEVLAAIDRVKMEMDINIHPPAVPLVFEPGVIDEEELPTCDEMDDDAFLGLNHEHFPDMEVGEGGVPPGTSKRPRQDLELELAVSNSSPSFDSTAHAISSFDADQIQQLKQIAQMQLTRKRLRLNSVGNLRTGWGHMKSCLKKEKMFSKATCPKENVFMENERQRPLFNGSFSQVSSSANSASFQVPAVEECFNVSDPGTSGISRSCAEALIADDPELQKSIRGLEAMLRVRDSLGSGQSPPLVPVTKVSASLAAGSGAGETDAVPALSERVSGLVETDAVPALLEIDAYGCRSDALILELVMYVVLLILEGFVVLLMQQQRLQVRVRESSHCRKSQSLRLPR